MQQDEIFSGVSPKVILHGFKMSHKRLAISLQEIIKAHAPEIPVRMEDEPFHIRRMK